MTPVPSGAVAPLRARTTPVDDPDVFGSIGTTRFVWWHDGRGLVAEGVARRVPAAGVTAALAAIEVDGAPGVAGTGPVAVGALPFDPEATSQGEMVIPARLWTHDDDGRTWYTEVSGGVDDSASGPAAPNTLTSVDAGGDMTEDQWAHTVAEVLARIDKGVLEKAVLARAVTVTPGGLYRPPRSWRASSMSNPGAMCSRLTDSSGRAPSCSCSGVVTSCGVAPWRERFLITTMTPSRCCGSRPRTGGSMLWSSTP